MQMVDRRMQCPNSQRIRQNREKIFSASRVGWCNDLDDSIVSMDCAQLLGLYTISGVTRVLI